MKNLKNEKAFTIIELIVVVAILGILVLLAGPRLLGYVEKAELARIQHDVKVMEQEMKLTLLEKEVEFAHWNNNKKNLGALVMQDKLFEKEGVAERIDASHLSKNGILVGNNNENTEFTKITSDEKLGVGGDMYLMNGDDLEFVSVDETYKIIPNEYKGVIGTRLGGTFYTNNLGKVYYEHDKPLASVNEGKELNCPVPLPDYDFKIVEGKGTILKWYGTEQHLVIPDAFLLEVNGEEQYVPVRVIGKEAFMQGTFKSVIIPESVEVIEDDAFIDGELTEITIPHSVEYIGGNAFANNPVTNGGTGKIIIRNGSGNVVIGENAFGGRTPTYRRPTAKDLGVIFDYGSGTIISGERGKKVVNIPDIILVDDVEYPVKKINKGAYQGLGLISVVLPEGLERIEDYAFAGNQLEGITIPDKVNHIGHYAFAFNEVVHSKTGHRKATIGFINIKGEDQFGKVNQYGDIYENGVKVDKLKDEVKLLNHIFVTSIGNHVIDEEYVESEFNKHMRNLKIIQKMASNYKSQHGKYPFSSTVPYDIEELKEFSSTIITANGEITNFANSKNYYDLDYDKLNINIKEDDKYLYMIDNEGQAYYLNELTKKGLDRKPGKVDSEGNLEGRTLLNVSFADNEGTARNELIDLSGNNIELKLKNFNHNANSGWTKEGLKFDGSNDYVAIPTKYMEYYKPKEQITIIIRAYMDDWQTNANRTLASTTQSGGWSMLVRPSSYLSAAINTSGRDTNYSTTNIKKTDISSGWHTFAFTYDRRFGKMYMDGELKDILDEGMYKDIIYNPNNGMLIGAEVNGNIGTEGMYFKGIISNVAIYDRALTSTEIQKVFRELNK